MLQRNFTERRTSGAKALTSLAVYGTAEAVPFVLTFPQPLKPRSRRVRYG
jgi:hypothetical protein